jgi:hypothetical protein
LFRLLLTLGSSLLPLQLFHLFLLFFGLLSEAELILIL